MYGNVMQCNVMRCNRVEYHVCMQQRMYDCMHACMHACMRVDTSTREHTHPLVHMARQVLPTKAHAQIYYARAQEARPA